MQLSPKQQKHFWSLWQKVCVDQGWTREAGFTSDEISAARKRLLNLAGFTSLTLVDPLEGFDRVLEQLAILRSDLSAVARASGMHITRLHYAIRALADEPYWKRICEDRFKTSDLDALSEDQLVQLRNTLTIRTRPARKARKQEMPLCPAALELCGNDPF